MTCYWNVRYHGAEGHEALLDFMLPSQGQALPVVVFAHGFKGFKDWGTWELIGRELVGEGFAFLKFNFTHNGTTCDQPTEFADLDAFGHNNFSRELADLDGVLDWLSSECTVPAGQLDLSKIFLVGHSRGGGIGLAKAALDQRIVGLVSWAGVSDLGFLWQSTDAVEQWRQAGVVYIANARTGQQMPIYFQLYEDFQANRERLDLHRAAASMDKPWLIVHGTADSSVPVASARQLKSWSQGAELALIEGADHVFGGGHPFAGASLPRHSEELIRLTVGFLERHLA